MQTAHQHRPDLRARLSIGRSARLRRVLVARHITDPAGLERQPIPRHQRIRQRHRRRVDSNGGIGRMASDGGIAEGHHRIGGARRGHVLRAGPTRVGEIRRSQRVRSQPARISDRHRERTHARRRARRRARDANNRHLRPAGITRRRLHRRRRRRHAALILSSAKFQSRRRDRDHVSIRQRLAQRYVHHVVRAAASGHASHC